MSFQGVLGAFQGFQKYSRGFSDVSDVSVAYHGALRAFQRVSIGFQDDFMTFQEVSGVVQDVLVMVQVVGGSEELQAVWRVIQEVSRGI